MGMWSLKWVAIETAVFQVQEGKKKPLKGDGKRDSSEEKGPKMVRYNNWSLDLAIWKSLIS